MRIKEVLERFVYTRRCPVCLDMMSYDMRFEAFCPECRKSWDKAKTAECPKCGNSVCECSCMTKTLSSSGAICHKKVVFYALDEAVVSKTIRFIKQNKNPRVIGFFAAQLAHVIRSDGELPTLDPENSVITYVPRSKKSVIKYGHDQSKMLAESLSKELSLECVTLMKRLKGGKEQKTLNASERAKNVRKLYELDVPSSYVQGKTVILVDDIVTTGSSMATCAGKIVKAGAKYLVAVSVASTEYHG